MVQKSKARLEGEKRRAKEMTLPLEERVALIKERKSRLEGANRQQETIRNSKGSVFNGIYDGG